jgi:hypothetical protein
MHLLQTGEWGELKSAFGWKPVRVVSGEVGVQILFRKLPLGFSIGYIPKAVVGDQYSVNSGQSLVFSEQFMNEIDTVCRKHRAVFYKLEPDLWNDQTPDTTVLSEREGWNLTLRTSPHNIQPPRTITIDISDTEEAILARMKQKTRYNIRLAEKKGVTVRAEPPTDNANTLMLVWLLVTVVLFAGVAVTALFVLRWREPNVPRPFSALGYPVAPAIFAITCLLIVLNALWTDLGRPLTSGQPLGPSAAGLFVIALGLPLFWWFSKRK